MKQRQRRGKAARFADTRPRPRHRRPLKRQYRRQLRRSGKQELDTLIQELAA